MSTSPEEIQLWCLAGAGGSAASFSRWRPRLNDRVGIALLELPGHGKRLREKPLRKMADVLVDLLAIIKPRLRRPFAFFGHSLGSVIAAECCRWLEREGVGVAEHLFVGSGVPPHWIPNSSEQHGRSNEDLLAYLRKLNGTAMELLNELEFMSIVLPALRADLEVLDSSRYSFGKGARLSCPITVIAGSQDDTIRPDALLEWKAHTSAAFAVKMVQGGHFASIQSATATNVIETALLKERCALTRWP